MAHPCPECAATCFCGGDVDVIVMSKVSNGGDCSHCLADLDDLRDPEEE